jgi:hypothetical protein
MSEERPLDAILGVEMYGIEDPEEMTHEEIMEELAEILALGYLRLRGDFAYIGAKIPSVETENGISGKVIEGSN